MAPSTPRRWATSVALVVVAATMTVLGVGPACASTPEAGPAGAPAAPQATFGLRPAQEGSTPLPGGNFNYSVPAGAAIHDAVIIENLTNSPLVLQTYAADLVALAGGGFGVSQLGAPTTEVGAWATIQPTVALAPLEQLAVPFTIHVPPGTPGGDYGGAVVAQNAPTANHGIAIQTRIAREVRIHVPGQAVLAATLGSLNTRRSGGRILFSADLVNTGTESFSFNGDVVLNRGGQALVVKLLLEPANDYLLPGEHVSLSGLWSDVPRFGSVRAHAEVMATPLSAGSKRLTDAAVTLSFFPWLLVILAIVALLLLLLVAREVWRRRDEWKRRWAEWRVRRRAVRDFRRRLTT